MNTKKILITGAVSGLAMWISLFIAGAIFARITYGAEMVPEGKFDESQINAFYFIWTKLAIGIFFGILFTTLCELSSLSKKIIGPLKGLKYAFVFWLVMSLWNLSHPLVYGPIDWADQLFWLIYTLFGFLGFGLTLGFLYKKQNTSLY